MSNQQIPYRYFTHTQTRDEIRNAYRKLAMKMHPDHGGSTEGMQALNAEYDMAIGKATRQEKPDWTEWTYERQAATDERIRQAIEAALAFDHLKIEICGLWVWITGTQRGDIAIPALKAAGYKWHAKKLQWFFPGCPSSNRKEMDMDAIRAVYGSEDVSRSAKRENAQAQPAGLPQ